MYRGRRIGNCVWYAVEKYEIYNFLNIMTSDSDGDFDDQKKMLAHSAYSTSRRLVLHL